MAQSTCVVTGTLSATAAGTTDFTQSGFGTVDAAVIEICGANATNNPQAVGRIGIGFWVSSAQAAVGVAQTDNATTTSTFRTSNDSFGIVVSNPTASQSDFTVSSITDGIRITLTNDNTTLAIFCSVILINGVDCDLITFTANATQNSTTESVGLDFAPKLLLIASITDANADTTGAGSSVVSFGVAEVNGAHRCLSFSSVTAVADEVANIMYSETRCVKRIINNLEGWGGEITTWGADTFTMTTRDNAATSTGICFVLALGGDVSYSLASFTTPTSTGVTAHATAGITPESAIIALSTATGTTLETGSGANGYSIGLLDANGQFAHNFSVEDGAGTTNCNSRYSATVPVLLDTSSGGTASTIVNGDLSALNSEEIAINYATVDATARKGWVLAFGPAFVPGAGSNHRVIGGGSGRVIAG